MVHHTNFEVSTWPDTVARTFRKAGTGGGEIAISCDTMAESAFEFEDLLEENDRVKSPMIAAPPWSNNSTYHLMEAKKERESLYLIDFICFKQRCGRVHVNCVSFVSKIVSIDRRFDAFDLSKCRNCLHLCITCLVACSD